MKRTTNNLKSVRERRGLSQEVLAERTEIRQETVSKLERRGFGRSVLQAVRMATELGTTVEQLVGDQLKQTKVHARRRDRRVVAPSGDTGTGGTAA